MNYISKIVHEGNTYHLKATTLRSVKITGDTEEEVDAGQVPVADGSGGITWNGINTGVLSFGEKTGAIINGVGLTMSGNTVNCTGMDYTATSPEEAHTSGGYRVAILGVDPGAGNYKAGWLYFILE